MAENGNAFQSAVREQARLDLEIIDRETEAALAATGCTPLIDPEARGVILFDIGGGSSELVRLGPCEPSRRGPPKPRISGWASLPVGVVTLGGAPRRRARHARDFRDHGHRSRRASGAVRRGPRRRARRHAHARHVRHGDDDLRRSSRSAALRAPAGRRLLDARARSQRRHRAPDRDELRAARRQSLHRRRARGPGARRLRHSRSDPPRVSHARACASPIAACARACWSS